MYIDVSSQPIFDKLDFYLYMLDDCTVLKENINKHYCLHYPKFSTYKTNLYFG